MQNCPTLADEQIDNAIYQIDGAMNDYDPADPEIDVPEFTPECLAKMRAVIRDLLAKNLIEHA